jgi:hypothetical protein
MQSFPELSYKLATKAAFNMTVRCLLSAMHSLPNVAFDGVLLQAFDKIAGSR